MRVEIHVAQESRCSISRQASQAGIGSLTLTFPKPMCHNEETFATFSLGSIQGSLPMNSLPSEPLVHCHTFGD